jgi:hypothetical protein
MTGDESALRELLHRAPPDLGSLRPPADLKPARQPRRTTFIAVGAAIVAVATVAIVIGLARQLGPGARHSGPGTAPDRSLAPSTSSVNQDGARHPLTVQIQLDQTTAPAGRPITGVAIVTNTAARPLTIADCNGTWLQVGLSNADLTYTPGWLDCLDIPGTILQPGTTRIPIRVNTTYLQCSPRANSSTSEMPACVHGHHGRLSMPPLPPGTYRTATGILDPKGVHVPTPESIQVTLTQ